MVYGITRFAREPMGEILQSKCNHAAHVFCFYSSPHLCKHSSENYKNKKPWLSPYQIIKQILNIDGFRDYSLRS